MNILRFMEEFPTEYSCKAHFKKQREQEGIQCKGCQGTFPISIVFVNYQTQLIPIQKGVCISVYPCHGFRSMGAT